MITPTKGIAPQRALLSIGAQIATVLTWPLTISQTYARLKEWRAEHKHDAPVLFGRFVLALDVLFTLNVLDFDGDLLRLRRTDASAPNGAR
ncbi:MAG: ABC-three component system middle component 6 [Gammaproteobacteria bacterium]